jgi:hypothetical protein
MTASRLFLSSLLATAPLLSFAQADAAAPTPRYYVGLAAYSSTYQPLSRNAYRGGTRVPFQVVAGYQLRPRLAVQLGVAYSGLSYKYSNAGSYSSPGSANTSYDYRVQNKERNTSVTLLARYTLTRKPAHRLQVDVLGGVTMEVQQYAYSSINIDTDSSQVVTYRYAESGTNWAYLVTAGPSVRYRFGRHLEALLDFTLSHDFDRSHRPYSSVFTGATALGLRYRFGGLR